MQTPGTYGEAMRQARRESKRLIPPSFVQPGPKDRWLIGKLVRRGYKILNGTPSQSEGPGEIWWHFWLPLENHHFDWCGHVFVSLRAGDYLMEARFRLDYSSDIHFTRYLRLRTRDGLERLAEFERLCHAMRRLSAEDVIKKLASNEEEAA